MTTKPKTKKSKEVDDVPTTLFVVNLDVVLPARVAKGVQTHEMLVQSLMVVFDSQPTAAHILEAAQTSDMIAGNPRAQEYLAQIDYCISTWGVPVVQRMRTVDVRNVTSEWSVSGVVEESGQRKTVKINMGQITVSTRNLKKVRNENHAS